MLATILAGIAWAADGDELPGWYFDAEIAQVLTAGNSESSTFGLGGKLRRLWTRSTLTFTGGATQTQSSLTTRTARGTATDFTVNEEKVTETTAELYFVRGWYRYNISPKFYVFTGADWLSNRFAGIDSRFLLAAGAGNAWVDSENLRFDTFYSVTYTFQEDVVENPFINHNFPGFRFGYNLTSKLSSSTDLESRLIGDWNLDNTDDIRFDWYNALPVGISETLLLKPSLQLLWLNEPALTEVPLVDAGGIDTGDKVLTPLKKLDTIFTLALVVKLGPKAE
jgi:putative salt-induced outer membrane protein YdiY